MSRTMITASIPAQAYGARPSVFSRRRRFRLAAPGSIPPLSPTPVFSASGSLGVAYWGRTTPALSLWFEYSGRRARAVKRSWESLGKFDAKARRREEREEIWNGGAIIVRFSLMSTRPLATNHRPLTTNNYQPTTPLTPPAPSPNMESGRARRGVSGALYSQSALARLNSTPRFRPRGPLPATFGVENWAPRGGEP